MRRLECDEVQCWLVVNDLKTFLGISKNIWVGLLLVGFAAWCKNGKSVVKTKHQFGNRKRLLVNELTASCRWLGGLGISLLLWWNGSLSRRKRNTFWTGDRPWCSRSIPIRLHRLRCWMWMRCLGGWLVFWIYDRVIRSLRRLVPMRSQLLPKSNRWEKIFD